MTTTLENDRYKVIINSLGAELASLISKKSNIEHIWQANPKVWKRHSPVLFPIVGKLENNKYRIENKEFELSQHGFARDMEFELENKSKNSLSFCLNWNDDTLKKFPFKFKLLIHYILTESKLNISYEVINVDNTSIYFSIGAHPGFTCPFFENENFSDYLLEFEFEENANRTLLSPDGLRSGEIENGYLKSKKKIGLSKDLFKDDALIFENLASKKITLKSLNHNHHLIFRWKDFNYLGIWSKPNAPFVCLEPWNGIADQKNYIGDFKEKKGINKLEISEKMACELSIECN